MKRSSENIIMIIILCLFVSLGIFTTYYAYNNLRVSINNQMNNMGNPPDMPNNNQSNSNTTTDSTNTENTNESSDNTSETSDLKKSIKVIIK